MRMTCEAAAAVAAIQIKHLRSASIRPSSNPRNMSIGHSSRFFEDGCLVKLSADFASHADAVGGPLKPGDIGTVLKAACGRYLVMFKEKPGWWYNAAALTTASASDAEAR